MQYNIASIGAAGRHKTATRKKDKALQNITFGDGFQDLPAECLWTLAQWATEYRAGYKETVGAGLALISEDMREEVKEYMNDESVTISNITAQHGNDEYFVSKGKWKSNQYLHKSTRQPATRYPDGWIRRGDSHDMWGDCHTEECDDQPFAPESKVEIAVQIMNNSSLTGYVSSYSGSHKFAKINQPATHCPPDEQRWRAFLYSVAKATGQYRQVAQIRTLLGAYKRGNRTLQAVAVQVKQMVEIGEIASVCDKMAKQNKLNLGIVVGNTLLDETAVSTLTNAMTD
jgi:hypothetical protein